MFKKLFTTLFITLISFSSFLAAEIEYEIQDIGTLQTCASEAIALNNNGQILGWYKIDETKEGKRYFVRDRDGCFLEIKEEFSKIYENIPQQNHSIKIDWRYLTDAGRAYGTFTMPNTNPMLFMWDRQSGIIKLGNLPGKRISAINNAGQVLLEYVEDTDHYGKPVKRPAIWEKGNITKLRGLEGNVGIESEESYGIDMNNKGEVVGQSLTSLVYKNAIYKQNHPVMWIDGQAIDLQKKVPKMDQGKVISINDVGEILIKSGDGNYAYFVGISGHCQNVHPIFEKINNLGSMYSANWIMRINDVHNAIHTWTLNLEIQQKPNSIWLNISKFISTNDNGEILAQGETIYGEKHAMLLVPKHHLQVIEEKDK